MRSWLDVAVCSALCGLPILIGYIAIEYAKPAGTVSLAGGVAYLWLTRWRHGDY